MFLAIAATTVAVQFGTVADYFPLEPGTKKVYQQTRGKMVWLQTDIVGKPVEIDGHRLTPIVTEVSGQKIGTTYYEIAGDAVFSVGVMRKDGKETCLDRVPILRVGEPKMKWMHAGYVEWFGKPYPQRMDASLAYKGKRKLFGKEVDVLEVRYDTVLGAGDGVADVHSKMTALYAKGVGLFEQQDESVVNKVKTKQSLKLIEFSPAQPASQKDN